MTLNDLEFSASLIADLYKNSLVETNETSTKSPSKQFVEKKEPVVADSDQDFWKHLGGNKKNILIIVDYPGSVHLPDEQLNFLTSMLAACKIGIGDVAITNLKNYPQPSYKDLFDHFKSKIVFLHGIEPSVLSLPISFPHFQVQLFAGCTFLFTPVLEELEKDKVLKSKLWVCLRRIFGI